MGVVHETIPDSTNPGADFLSDLTNAGYLDDHPGIGQFRVGAVAVTLLDTVISIVFSSALPDANYEVFLQPKGNTNVVAYPTAMTAAGFTLNLSAGVNATFAYLAVEVP